MLILRKGYLQIQPNAEYVKFDDDEYSETQYIVPKVEGINGYTFGWLEINIRATDGNWDVDAKTFGITGLLLIMPKEVMTDMLH